MSKNSKIIFSVFIFSVIIILLFSWNSHKNDIIYIRNYIKQCCSELISEQIKRKTRTKNFTFGGQTFTMSIDTLGKPIFLKDFTPVESIILEYKNDNYTVELINGIITVDRE